MKVNLATIKERSILGFFSKSTNLKAVYENFMEKIVFFCACLSILCVLIITFFIFSSGGPFIMKEGIWNFLAGTEWRPMQGIFGILPMIVGTIMLTFGSTVMAVFFGVGGAVFMAEFSPKQVAKILRPCIQLLAGVPSVVYGFWGLIVLVPFLRSLFGGSGFSALAGSIILAIMILPTIVNISEDALLNVPNDLKEGSLALGSTQWQMVKHIMFPVARQGIIAGIVLGMGRAIGETMAIVMVTGNVVAMPSSFLDEVRALTSNIVIEMAYAARGDHRDALFATGVVLFVFIMILNTLVNLRYQKKE